jgi:[acyl-carrier-protein] S-malonyltransferase
MARTAVLFPGQGAQFVGMTADLIDRCPETAPMFERASALLGVDLWEVASRGPKEKLQTTAMSQPAIFVVSLAVCRAIEAAGAGDRLRAVGTAGLSLGEYSALVFSGATPFEDTLEVVVRRGEFMQEACDEFPGGMTTILGLELDAVREIVDEARSAGVIAVANVNASTQIVVSGEFPALERAAEIASDRGARRTVPLQVAGAYHSPLMASATAKLAPFLERLEIVSPRIPFYPNVLGEPESDPERIREGLRRQIESPVLFAPTLERLIAAGIDRVVEPGPGRVIAGLVKRVERRIPVDSVLDAESVATFAELWGAHLVREIVPRPGGKPASADRPGDSEESGRSPSG